MKGVIRIEQPEKNSPGWQGRLSCEVDDERPPSKFFLNQIHSGKKAAEAKCSAWVKRQHRNHCQHYVEKAPVFTRANRSTGLVGVYWTPAGNLPVRATFRRRSKSKMLDESATLESAARARRQHFQPHQPHQPSAQSLKRKPGAGDAIGPPVCGERHEACGPCCVVAS